MPRPSHLLLLSLALASPATAQTLDTRIDAATQRWQTLQENLRSADPVIRSEALAVALRDDNQGIRNGAIGYALGSKRTLSIDLLLPPGSAIDPSAAPTLDVTNAEWDRERKTVRGRNNSQRVRSAVEGDVIDGAIHLVYANLGFAPGFGGADSQPSRRQPRPERHRCSLTLSFQPSRNAFEGPLQCEGLSQRLVARLPVG